MKRLVLVAVLLTLSTPVLAQEASEDESSQVQWRVGVSYFGLAYRPAIHETTRISLALSEQVVTSLKNNEAYGYPLLLGVRFGHLDLELTHYDFTLPDAYFDTAFVSVVPLAFRSKYGTLRRQENELNAAYFFAFDGWSLGAGAGLRHIRTFSGDGDGVSSYVYDDVSTLGPQAIGRLEVPLGDFVTLRYGFDLFYTRGRRKFESVSNLIPFSFIWLSGAHGTRGVFFGYEHNLSLGFAVGNAEIMLGYRYIRSEFWFEHYYVNGLPYSSMFRANLNAAAIQTTSHPDRVEGLYFGITTDL